VVGNYFLDFTPLFWRGWRVAPGEVSWKLALLAKPHPPLRGTFSRGEGCDPYPAGWGAVLLSVPAYTADRSWTKLNAGVEIKMVR
jgi:hypothetical protein